MENLYDIENDKNKIQMILLIDNKLKNKHISKW